jgi:hypothetical protein
LGTKELKRAIAKKADKDDFEVGAVVRWTMTFADSGRLDNNSYTYAAVKTPVGWVSTARYNGRTVPQTMTYDRLTTILAMSETSDIAVAFMWETIS